MSHFTSGLIGGTVAAVAFGMAQLAMGSDIAGVDVAPPVHTVQKINDVNRATKADRVVTNSTDPSATKTVAIRIAELPETLVLIRIPTPMRRDGAIPQTVIKSASMQTATTRRQVACEPVVSVLTEVAKSLQPGRCVT